MRIINIDKVTAIKKGPADPSWSSMKELGKFLIQFFFVIFYLIAALLPLLAMTVAFIIRIPIIWLTTAFMPFMFIGFILGDKMGSFNSMAIFKHFVKAAFLPTVVAIPLSVGFIMITAGIKASCKDVDVGALCDSAGMILPGISNLWTLLWSFLAIFVMWAGVFMALKIDENVYGKVGGYFQNIGQNWGKFALKAPLALPILPMGAGKNKSIMEVAGPAGAFARNPNIAIHNGAFDFKNMRNRMMPGSSGGRDISPTRRAALNDMTKATKELSTKMRVVATAMRSPAKTADNRIVGDLAAMMKVKNVKSHEIRASLEAYNTNQTEEKDRIPVEQIGNLSSRIATAMKSSDTK